MGMRISTNLTSLAAQRSIQRTDFEQKAALERLSTGARINHAADDSAGLGVSQKLNSYLRSNRQDIRNVQDGVSMVQTAEGGLSEISSILVRMRELSIQSSSDTISDTERGFINKEVSQLTQEVDRITEATEFNGRNRLLDGQGGRLEIQVGLNNDAQVDRYTINQSELDSRTSSLGIAGISVATKEQARSNLARLDNAIDTLNRNRASLGAMQNRMGSAIASLSIFDENLASAHSRIRDTDMAEATTELTKQGIISQSKISVLAQANQSPALALKLLG